MTYFQKISVKIFFRFWSKNGWFYKILEKLKKKKNSLPKWKIWVVVPIKQGFFFFFLSFFFFFALSYRYEERERWMCAMMNCRARKKFLTETIFDSCTKKIASTHRPMINMTFTLPYCIFKILAIIIIFDVHV